MKKMQWLIVVIITLTGCSTGKYFLQPQELPQWIVSPRHHYTKVEELKQILGESFQLYRGYQIKKLITQEISSSDFKQMLLEVFVLSDEVNARGLYRRYQTFTPALVGTESSQGPGSVVFYRKNYFVRLTARRNLLGKEESLREVAKIVDIKLNGK